VQVTYDQLARWCDDEMERSAAQSKGQLTDFTTNFLQYFASASPMPIEELINPATPDSLHWRMTAWAFVHMNLYARKNEYGQMFSSYLKLLQKSNAQPAAAFKEAYGIEPAKFTVRLTGYIHGGLGQVPVYKLSEEEKNRKLVFKDVTDREVVPFKAGVLIARGHKEEAGKLIDASYKNKDNRSSRLLELKALLEPNKDQAAAMLEKAIEAGPLTQEGYLRLAQSRYERLSASAAGTPFTAEQTRHLLEPALHSYQAGCRKAALYHLVTDVWTATSLQPTTANLTILVEGAQLYPADQALVEKVRTLLVKTGRPNAAEALKKPQH
jgi:hypothetical protein